MQTRIWSLKCLFCGNLRVLYKPRAQTLIQFKHIASLILNKHESSSNFRTFHNESHEHPESCSEGNHGFLPSPVPSKDESSAMDSKALEVQALLKQINGHHEIEQALTLLGLSVNEDLVLNILRRHRSDWKSAYLFFTWVSNSSGYSPGTGSYNEILDILGRFKRFTEVSQLLDEMSNKNNNLINERTYGVVVNRYAAAHKIEDAIDFFYKRKQFGLKLDLIAFQTLLLSLCRYKHVEAAEFLFHSKKHEFPHTIKTMNIILNGWCILGSLRESKRFWNDIVSSKHKPDKFTYSIFINSLTKSGKITTAVNLFQAMWEKGCTPDVTICNTIIDGLCFKKRIPQALEIFREMNDKHISPNVSTYNSLIKHLCKIRRMDKVNELLKEMKSKGDDYGYDCRPNDRTYCYLLNCAKNVEEVVGIKEEMERGGVRVMGDGYNLMLRLFMGWGDEERVRWVWGEMEKKGVGHDQRSYTIMVHGFYEMGRLEEALGYYNEMVSKGMVSEPRTKVLVQAIDIKLKEGEQKSMVATEMNV
ncbi:hypothetical protein LXL04_039545 [Taraxacum kok-saghyz]